MTAVYRDFDRAALDAQYDMRRAVPDHQVFFDRYEADSAAVREASPVRLDLAYGAHPLERLDLFPAERAHGPSPVLLFIHGGYWFAFDKRYFSYPAPHWTDRGVAFASINYPLCPGATMDELVASVRASVRWLAANAAGLGVDPDRIYVTGHSAGGHLTAMVLADPDRPAGVVGGLSISGLFDLEPIRLSYLNAHLHLDEASARRNSPLHLVPAAAPEQLFCVGGAETPEFRRQQAEYHAAWTGAGLRGDVVEAPGAHHFSVVDGLADPDSVMFRAILRRLRPELAM